MKCPLLSLVFVTVLSIQSFAKSKAEESVDNKLGLIQKISAECDSGFQDHYAFLRYLPSLILYTDSEIVEVYSKLKADSQGSCQKFDDSVQEHLKASEALYFKIQESLKSCQDQQSEISRIALEYEDAEADPALLLSPLKFIDFSKSEACDQALESIRASAKLIRP